MKGLDEVLCGTCASNIRQATKMGKNLSVQCAISSQYFEQVARDHIAAPSIDGCTRLDIWQTMIYLYNTLLMKPENVTYLEIIDELKCKHNDDVPMLSAIDYVGNRFDLEG